MQIRVQLSFCILYICSNVELMLDMSVRLQDYCTDKRVIEINESSSSSRGTDQPACLHSLGRSFS